MTQEPAHPDPDEARTGDPELDALLDQVASLDDRPVDEHVAVYEAAHEQLRTALDPPESGEAGGSGSG